ncbi:50S ribosomal protein L25/general stress protein Ctc [Falsibacillus albus]|uniref:Large ribosomal subunit protein bL25 n=1 Tax=Falsibacillus albus TaxID=2478915 RepID=A0A3L7JLR6_9BACI|nr:50S ribosomal protein L25/general stress protein Ctc [Falsibacillus albus]RLQ91686.1 50S ribosomal protein L25/general stress protein Ctc [Falsibacillus albus]
MTSVLNAQKRERFKKSDLRKLRSEGNFPAVVYGHKVENTPIYVESAEFIKTIREVGRNGVISLNFSGNKQNVILSEYQEDTIKNEIVHADFLAVDMSSEIDADVRVELVGEAPGVKDGGVMQQPLHEVSVTAKPNEIPESIQVDVAGLEVGDTLSIGDIKGNYSVTINHEDDETIASILAPRQEEEISTGEEQEAGVPENEEGRETEASEESEEE